MKTFQAEVPGVCSSGRTTSRPRGRLAHTLERGMKKKINETLEEELLWGN